MRKTYKYDEKVVCLYCDNEIVYKNLKNHTENKHGMQPIRYKSASSQNISDMWKKSSVEINPEKKKHFIWHCDYI